MAQPNRTSFFLLGLLAVIVLSLFFLIGREPSFQSAPPAAEPDEAASPPLEITAEEALPDLPSSQTQPLGDSVDPEVRHWNEEGVAFYTQGEYEAAADRFQNALDRNPGNAVLRENLAYAKGGLGWHWIEAGRYYDALSSFQEALNLKSREPAFYMGLGLAYHRLHDDDRAIDSLKQAIDYRSNYAQAYKLLGEIFYLRDEMDLAVGYLEKASQLDPDDAGVRQRLDKAQREKAAQSDFQQHASLHFTVKFEGREERGAAQEIMGLLEEAYREIGQALSSYPESPVTVILYSEQQFRDVTLTPSWSQGLFDGKIRIPIEGFRNEPALLKKVVYHEYTHAVIHELGGSRVPTWLNEGIALNLEGEERGSWEDLLLDRIRRSQSMIPLGSLHGSFLGLSDEAASLAYAESYSATRYLIDRYGLYRIKELLFTLPQESDFEKAFLDRILVPYTEFEKDWREELTRRARQNV